MLYDTDNKILIYFATCVASYASTIVTTCVATYLFTFVCFSTEAP